MSEIFGFEQALKVLQRKNIPVFFNASYLGNCVTIKVEGFEPSPSLPEQYHIHGEVVESDERFSGDYIDNWMSKQEYGQRKLEKLSGDWFIL